MLAASKPRSGGEYHFSLCSAAHRSLKKRSSAGPLLALLRVLSSLKPGSQPSPLCQLLGRPAIYSHRHLHGPRQGNSVSPSSLFVTSQYLIKLFPPPSHCPSPFSIHHLCFSLTRENLCLQNYSCPPAFVFWLPSNLPSVLHLVSFWKQFSLCHPVHRTHQ